MHLFDAFADLLTRARPNCDEVYILGDLVEVWVGDDDDAPLADRLRMLLREASRHCDVYVMHGNRDFLLGSRFASATGCRLIDDPTLLACRGHRILLAHGDAYCTDDAPYQQMRTLFRSPTWQAGVLARALEDRRAMARALRQQSLEANANKAENIMDVTPSEIDAAVSQHDADVVVHGHTHRPAIHDHVVAGRRVRRYVLGDWSRCGWALRLDASGFNLLRFPVMRPETTASA
jgi:UDP-2,3-diacylglucosamine hydrolase